MDKKDIEGEYEKCWDTGYIVLGWDIFTKEVAVNDTMIIGNMVPWTSHHFMLGGN